MIDEVTCITGIKHYPLNVQSSSLLMGYFAALTFRCISVIQLDIGKQSIWWNEKFDTILHFNIFLTSIRHSQMQQATWSARLFEVTLHSRPAHNFLSSQALKFSTCDLHALLSWRTVLHFEIFLDMRNVSNMNSDCLDLVTTLSFFFLLPIFAYADCFRLLHSLFVDQLLISSAGTPMADVPAPKRARQAICMMCYACGKEFVTSFGFDQHQTSGYLSSVLRCWWWVHTHPKGGHRTGDNADSHAAKAGSR